MTADVGSAAKAAWRIPEWASATGVGRSKIYELLAAGQIASVCIGRRRVIVTSPADFIKAMPGLPGARWVSNTVPASS